MKGGPPAAPGAPSASSAGAEDFFFHAGLVEGADGVRGMGSTAATAVIAQLGIARSVQLE
jgi:hypothetical protein